MWILLRQKNKGKWSLPTVTAPTLSFGESSCEERQKNSYHKNPHTLHSRFSWEKEILFWTKAMLSQEVFPNSLPSWGFSPTWTRFFAILKTLMILLKFNPYVLTEVCSFEKRFLTFMWSQGFTSACIYWCQTPHQYLSNPSPILSL